MSIIRSVSSIGRESTGIRSTNEARRDRSEYTFQDCAICMDELSSIDNGEPTRFSSCPHIFHANCVAKWRVIGSNGNLCPVCRVPMDDGTTGIDISNVVRRTGIHSTNEARGGWSEDTIQECVICTYEISCFDEYEPIARLSYCPHIFHANCVENWRMRIGNLCPVCEVPMHVVEDAPAPPRLTGDRHTRHETRRFLPDAGQPRRSLSTRIYSYSRILMIWLADNRSSRPLSLHRDKYKVLILIVEFAVTLLSVHLLLRYGLHEFLIKKLLPWLMYCLGALIKTLLHWLMYGLDALIRTLLHWLMYGLGALFRTLLHWLMYGLDALFNYVIPVILLIIFVISIFLNVVW